MIHKGFTVGEETVGGELGGGEGREPYLNVDGLNYLAVEKSEDRTWKRLLSEISLS